MADRQPLLFVTPNAVAIDGSDNLYIADNTSREIRKVSAQTGIINAVAGNGTFLIERGRRAGHTGRT